LVPESGAKSFPPLAPPEVSVPLGTLEGTDIGVFKEENQVK